jgi:hypothetical protein
VSLAQHWPICVTEHFSKPNQLVGRLLSAVRDPRQEGPDGRCLVGCAYCDCGATQGTFSYLLGGEYDDGSVWKRVLALLIRARYQSVSLHFRQGQPFHVIARVRR